MVFGESLEEWIESLHQNFLAEGFGSELIARVAGYPIYAYSRPSSCSKTWIYLSSGVHGDEPAGPLAIQKLLEQGFFTDSRAWLICPFLNPVGFSQGIRENGQGIDLNRDYLSKHSEEVRAHTVWIEKQPSPTLILSLHEDWESTGYYFYEVNKLRGEPKCAAALMDTLDQVMQREPKDVVDDSQVREPGWIYYEGDFEEFDAWPEVFFLVKRGCPLALTMETPSSVDLAKRIEVQMLMVQKAIEVWSR
jgi:murein peptide amidase A